MHCSWIRFIAEFCNKTVCTVIEYQLLSLSSWVVPVVVVELDHCRKHTVHPAYADRSEGIIYSCCFKCCSCCYCFVPYCFHACFVLLLVCCLFQCFTASMVSCCFSFPSDYRLRHYGSTICWTIKSNRS